MHKRMPVLLTAVIGLLLGTGYAVADWTTPRQPSIPPGTIVMWAGPADEIPRGWAVCDGSGGTPDLRDRFIVGAGAHYEAGQTGGVEETIHDHEILNHPARQLAAGNDYTALTNAAANDNRPPYYAITFIMRLP